MFWIINNYAVKKSANTKKKFTSELKMHWEVLPATVTIYKYYYCSR